MCAVCPVELAKPALGYREDENRIGARERDWVVGLPDLGFVYPAFANRGSDVNAVMYYVKTGRPSHPEFIENVLGCVAQRTAAEDKLAFKNVVHDAFGEDEEQADAAFFQMQKTISAMVAEREEDESLPAGRADRRGGLRSGDRGRGAGQRARADREVVRAGVR